LVGYGVLIQYCVASSVGCLTYGYLASAGIDANHAVGNALHECVCFRHALHHMFLLGCWHCHSVMGLRVHRWGFGGWISHIQPVGGVPWASAGGLAVGAAWHYCLLGCNNGVSYVLYPLSFRLGSSSTIRRGHVLLSSPVPLRWLRVVHFFLLSFSTLSC
jgi:hypothetical protein